MACITKLNKAITFGCAGGSVGLSELLLVNKADIENIYIYNNIVSSISLMSGARAYAVDCYKNGVRMVEAMRTLDGAGGMEQTVTVTIYDKSVDGATIKEALMNGKFVAFGKLKDGGNIQVAGAIAGLEATAVDSDSSASGGFATVSLTTPEGSRGDLSCVANTVTWNYLQNLKVT